MKRAAVEERPDGAVEDEHLVPVVPEAPLTLQLQTTLQIATALTDDEMGILQQAIDEERTRRAVARRAQESSDVRELVRALVKDHPEFEVLQLSDIQLEHGRVCLNAEKGGSLMVYVGGHFDVHDYFHALGGGHVRFDEDGLFQGGNLQVDPADPDFGKFPVWIRLGRLLQRHEPLLECIRARAAAELTAEVCLTGVPVMALRSGYAKRHTANVGGQ